MIQTRALAPTLIDTSRLATKCGLVVGGAAVTACASQIQIPWHPVPFTLQTFAVLTCGLVLGSRLGAASQLLYLLAGAAGMPVFAGFRAGLGGPTTGYLFAFVLAAYAVGWCAERGWDRTIYGMLAVLIAAQAIILLIGTSWLSLYVGGFSAAWKVGVIPFVVGEAIKSLVIVLGLPGAWKLIGDRATSKS